MKKLFTILFAVAVLFAGCSLSSESSAKDENISQENARVIFSVSVGAENRSIMPSGKDYSYVISPDTVKIEIQLQNPETIPESSVKKVSEYAWFIPTGSSVLVTATAKDTNDNDLYLKKYFRVVSPILHHETLYLSYCESDKNGNIRLNVDIPQTYVYNGYEGCFKFEDTESDIYSINLKAVQEHNNSVISLLNLISANNGASYRVKCTACNYTKGEPFVKLSFNKSDIPAGEYCYELYIRKEDGIDEIIFKADPTIKIVANIEEQIAEMEVLKINSYKILEKVENYSKVYLKYKFGENETGTSEPDPSYYFDDGEKICLGDYKPEAWKDYSVTNVFVSEDGETPSETISSLNEEKITLLSSYADKTIIVELSSE